MARAAEISVAVDAELRAERDRLAQKVARAAMRLGNEAGAWKEVAAYVDDPRLVSFVAIANTARARAADLERFVREELASAVGEAAHQSGRARSVPDATSGATEPAVLLPVSLAVRLLNQIEPLRCCWEVRPNPCTCPRGVLRQVLRAAIAGGKAAEPVLEETRR